MASPSPLDYYQKPDYSNNRMNTIPGGVTVPDIPLLKKREDEKERKGMGFLWPGARLASAVGRWAGGSSTWLGSLLLSPTGPWIATSILAGVFVGGLVGGTWFMGRAFSPAQSSTFVAPAIGHISGIASSGIRIYKPQDASLQDLTRANPAAFKPKYDAAAVPTKTNFQEESKPKTEEAKPPTQDPNELAEALKAQLGNQNIGGLSGGTDTSFGSWSNLSKNILGDQDNRFHLKTNFVQPPTIAKLSSSLGKQAIVSASKLNQMGATAGRAMGQAKFAKGMSVNGATAGAAEAGHTYAADAFSGQSTQGGQMSPIGGEGLNTGTAGIIGSGAPNTTPSPGSGQNATPYQPTVDQAQQAASNSGSSKLMSIIELAVGAVLIAAGVAILAEWMLGGLALGWALIIAGLMMVAMGIMNLMKSNNQAQQAQQAANQIATNSGQTDQAGNIDKCTNQANTKGTAVPDCPPTLTPHEKALSNPNDQVHQNVLNEQNATYEIDGGAPIKN